VAVQRRVIEIGPIPKGTPINLLSNIDLERRAELLAFVARAKGDLKSLRPTRPIRSARGIRRSREAASRDQQVPRLRRQIAAIIFGTDYFAEERALTMPISARLIAFLKTL
jgi:chorismate mutase